MISPKYPNVGICIDGFSHPMIQSGWWFGTFVVFPSIGNIYPNLLIFFRGVQTTNQQRCFLANAHKECLEQQAKSRLNRSKRLKHATLWHRTDKNRGGWGNTFGTFGTVDGKVKDPHCGIPYCYDMFWWCVWSYVFGHIRRIPLVLKHSFETLKPLGCRGWLLSKQMGAPNGCDNLYIMNKYVILSNPFNKNDIQCFCSSWSFM